MWIPKGSGNFHKLLKTHFPYPPLSPPSTYKLCCSVKPALFWPALPWYYGWTSGVKNRHVKFSQCSTHQHKTLPGFKFLYQSKTQTSFTERFVKVHEPQDEFGGVPKKRKVWKSEQKLGADLRWARPLQVLDRSSTSFSSSPISQTAWNE